MAILDDPAALWQSVLADLQLQMTKATFDSCLRGSVATCNQPDVATCDGPGLLTIHTPHPNAIGWLEHRLQPTVLRTVRRLAGEEWTVAFVAEAIVEDQAPAEQDPAPAPRPPRELAPLLDFNPNTADSGGFSLLGNYATRYWGALLGAIGWRIYTLVYADDKRRDKTDWTPPRRRSISDLARLIAGGRAGQGNRNQITGRRRGDAWIPGAFDTLIGEGVALIEWHAGNGRWQPWQPNGAGRPAEHGLRLIYRISVATRLPLLTPTQVTRLAGDLQIDHEHYLLDRGIDLHLWEQITAPTLAGLDETTYNCTNAAVTAADRTKAQQSASFFPPPTAPLSRKRSSDR